MSQSNQGTFLQGGLKVNFLRCVAPYGGGGPGAQTADDRVFLQNKFSVIRLLEWASADNNWLPRALVIAKAYLENAKAGYKLLTLQKQQRIDINRLCREAGVDPTEMCGIPESQKFAVSPKLKDYNILVFTDSVGKDVMLKGNKPVEAEEKRITLYYSTKIKHFAVIRSMTGFTGRQEYCFRYRQAYDSIGRHVCLDACRKCHGTGVEKALCPVQPRYRKKCDVCNSTFYNNTCFDGHRSEDRTVCQVRQFCTKCLTQVNMRDKKFKHNCEEFYCNNCKKVTFVQSSKGRASCKPRGKPNLLDALGGYFDESDESSEEEEEEEQEEEDKSEQPQQPLPGRPEENEKQETKKEGKKEELKKKQKPKQKPFVYVVFDLETWQESNYKDKDNEWVHEANLCVSQTACLDCMAEIDVAKNCKFCGVRQQIFKGDNCVEQFMGCLLTRFKKVIVLAHNMGGFDGAFIMSYLCDKPNSGHGPPKFIQRGTKLINIEYSRSTWRIKNHIGKIPSPEMYGVDKMSDKEFNFAEKLVTYCIADVDVLRKAMIKYRDLWLRKAEIDPFRECNTLSGACMLNFRANYLEAGSICIIPRGRFFEDVQSKVAVEWLRYEAFTRQIDIQHAQSTKEHRASKYKLDGYHPKGENGKPLAFEFQGCYFHAHPPCFPIQTAVINEKETMGDRYRKTLKKRELLESLGYEVVEMWKCEWERRKEDPAVQRFLAEHPVEYEEPLNLLRGEMQQHEALSCRSDQ
ncbi:hypothetical protein FOCC_FOCC012728 [Frankliniella occidentalis]|nr:hypothetical protein FOCC_FOCC012728 [Frankliniella occidentalis]